MLLKTDHFSETTSNLPCEFVIFLLLTRTDKGNEADLTQVTNKQRKGLKVNLTQRVLENFNPSLLLANNIN